MTSLNMDLIEACENGDFEGAVRALDAGADPNASNTETNLAAMTGTALMRATKHGFVDIARLLLERGADPDARDERCTFIDNALHFSAFHGQVEVARVLLAFGARINEHCRLDGETALHSAAGNCQLNMVQFLLESSADVNCKDKFGATALDKALMYRNKAMVSILEKFGAVKGLPDEDRTVDRSTLIRKLTFEEAQADFGKYKEWKEIFTEIKTGDEFWTYPTSAESWKMGMGQAGLVLIRDDKIIDGIVTELN